MSGARHKCVNECEVRNDDAEVFTENNLSRYHGQVLQQFLDKVNEVRLTWFGHMMKRGSEVM